MTISPDIDAASTESPVGAATSDGLLADLRALIPMLTDGRSGAAKAAAALLTRLDDHLSHGGALPEAWAYEATATLTHPDGTVEKVPTEVDEKGDVTVEVPSLAAPAVEDGHGQFGFSFDENDQPDEETIPALGLGAPGQPAGSLPGVTPAPRTLRSRPRPDSPAAAGVTLTGDMLTHGTFTASLNAPIESHKVQQKMTLKAGQFNHEVFWTIYDANKGLADHELEQRLNRSHQSLSATRNTLMNKGFIEKSGETRLTPYGNEANVWVPTAEAYRLVADGKVTRGA